MVVTEKEQPTAERVFAGCGPMVELPSQNAWTNEQFAGEDHLPYVLVRSAKRSNLGAAHEVNHWTRQFRPQAFLIVGTAGGVWRPVDSTRVAWKGPARGDVVFSEYIHYADYLKVADQNLRRYHRLEQPEESLVRHAQTLATHSGLWHPGLGQTWDDLQPPAAHEEEILSGEQVQDNPRDARQQFLMESFDRAGAEEMESAGIALALHEVRSGSATYAPGFLTVRGVSDLIWARDADGPLTAEDVERAESFDTGSADSGADGSKSAERDSWSSRAAAAAAAFALALVRRVSVVPVEKTLPHPLVPSHELELSVPAPRLRL